MAFTAKHNEMGAETSEAMEHRFRPIVPKPMPPLPMPIGAMVSNIQWRAQKRSQRDYLVASPVSKRGREAMFYPSPPAWWPTSGVEAPLVTRGRCMPEISLPSYEEHLPRLSLEVPFASSWAPLRAPGQLFPIEHDLISKLQVPKVIKPLPTRPKRSIIRIDSTNLPVEIPVSKKTVREVKEEMELPHVLPAIVSGRNNNRVHLTNDAYKEMVEQPVCLWLDSLPGAGTSRRINGEVFLHVRTFDTVSCLPIGRCAFPCTARISWDREDAIALLKVPCAVERLSDNPDDYSFIWRFDSKSASVMYCKT
ncbi:unnamed protein product [Urochloa humidicola]